MTKAGRHLVFILLALLLCACGPSDQSSIAPAVIPGDLTAAGAAGFVGQAEKELASLLAENEKMAWVYSNFITQDTESLAALANKKFTAKQVELAATAAGYLKLTGVDSDTRRKLKILRSDITMPAPRDSQKTAEQSSIGPRLGGMYGKGEYCYADGVCLDLGHLGDIMAESRDPDALLEAWNGWRMSTAE